MKSLKLLLLLFVLPVITQAQKKTDIAYVSMEVILAQYAPAIKAMSDIESLKMQYQSTHDSMLIVIGKLHQDLNKKMESLSDAEREKVFEKIRMKEDELEKFIQIKFAEPNGELAKKKRSS